MTFQREKEFQAFLAGRNRLNEQLDRLKDEVDHWLAAHNGDADPSMTDIAELAGLLETRKDLLSELAQHDDNFITYLLNLRASHQP